MSALGAIAAAAAAYLLATRRSGGTLGDRLGIYVLADRRLQTTPENTRPRLPDRRLLRMTAAAAVGAVAGVSLTGAGTPGPSTVVGMGLAGAATGALGVGIAARRRRETRRRSLGMELPTVADALALGVLAGESVPTAIHRFCAEASGVAAAELDAVADRHRRGRPLTEALTEAARSTDHEDAARLYEALAHAHRAGGRLADRLAALAADFRACIARDIVAEGGRRALATYGPILALQIPVTLLFLMYPTLVGLAELSATP